MLPQGLQRHDLQRALMRRGEHDRRRHPVGVGLQPARRDDTPAVAGNQAREVVERQGGLQVVADAALVLEELGGHDRADCVTTEVLRTGAATAVAVEPGDRIRAAWLEVAAEDIAIALHGLSLPVSRCSLRVA